MRLFQLNIQAAMARRVERAERSHCCGADSPVQLASSIFYLSSFFLSLFLPPSPSYLLSSVLSLSVYIYIFFFFFFFLLPYTHNLVPDDDGMERGGREKKKGGGRRRCQMAHTAMRSAPQRRKRTTRRRDEAFPMRSDFSRLARFFHRGGLIITKSSERHGPSGKTAVNYQVKLKREFDRNMYKKLGRIIRDVDTWISNSSTSSFSGRPIVVARLSSPFTLWDDDDIPLSFSATKWMKLSRNDRPKMNSSTLPLAKGKKKKER